MQRVASANPVDCTLWGGCGAPTMVYFSFMICRVYQGSTDFTTIVWRGGDVGPSCTEPIHHLQWCVMQCWTGVAM